MANRARKDMRKAYRRKGFIQSEGGQHEQWTFAPHGVVSPVKTTISRGSSYKTYGDDLLKWVRKELKLPSKNDLLDLIDCTTTHEQSEDQPITLGEFDKREAIFRMSKRKPKQAETCECNNRQS